MTITELITSLQEVPQHRREERVVIYVDGDISGYLETRSFTMDDEDEGEYNFIATKRLRQPRGE